MRTMRALLVCCLASLATSRLAPRSNERALAFRQPRAVEKATAALKIAPGGAGVKAADDEIAAAVRKTILVVATACLFGVGVGATRGKEVAMEFFAGYLVEQSLSVDNLFVFILLFEYFKVPPSMQGRALKWGIIGAVLMRGVMILVGVELVQRFRSVTLVFAGILLASAAKLLTEGDHDEAADDNAIIALSRKLVRSVPYYDGDRFFTKLRDGSRAATPLLLCVVCIELSDFVFAVDSIPAVLAISKDPFIVYSSNIFAIAALRSLYQVLAAAIEGLPYLRPAVALILGFVGLKMLAEYFHVHIPTSASLGAIVAILGGGVALSLLLPPAEQKKH